MLIPLLIGLFFILAIIGVIYLLYSKIKDFFNQIGKGIGGLASGIGGGLSKAVGGIGSLGKAAGGLF